MNPTTVPQEAHSFSDLDAVRGEQKAIANGAIPDTRVKSGIGLGALSNGHWMAYEGGFGR